MVEGLVVAGSTAGKEKLCLRLWEKRSSSPPLMGWVSACGDFLFGLWECYVNSTRRGMVSVMP